MKNFILKLIIVALCSLAILFSFIGCLEDDESGFIVDNPTDWKSVYMVGEDLSLDGLKIKYYPSVENLNDYQSVNVTLDMVENFDSSSAGNKTFTIKYKGLETPKISYVVVEYTPFTVDYTFCIDDNVVANINSASNKATITSYACFSDYVTCNGVTTQIDLMRTVERNQSLLDDNYLSALSFTYQNRKISYVNIPNENSIIMITNETTTTSQTAKSLISPNLTATYKSDVDENGYVVIAKFDQNYGLNVYLVEDGTDISTTTPIATFTAENCVLQPGNIFKYTIDGCQASFSNSFIMFKHFSAGNIAYTHVLNAVE